MRNIVNGKMENKKEGIKDFFVLIYYMETLSISNTNSSHSNQLFFPKFEKKYLYFNFTSQYFNLPNKSLIFVFGNPKCGKTLFFDLLTAQLYPDNEIRIEHMNFLNYKICYKKENMSPKFSGTVSDFLNNKIDETIKNHTFFINLLEKLEINKLFNKLTNQLFGNELQILLFIYQLANTNYDIYLIDLPNDIEKNLKEQLINFSYEYAKLFNKVVFIVENDLNQINHYPNEYVIYFEKITKRRYFTHNIQDVDTFLRNF
jgi:translation initiation factor RLI1